MQFFPHSHTLDSCARSRSNERGASLVEYALLIALISAVGVVAIHELGFAVRGTFKTVNDRAVAAAGGVCDSSNPLYPNCTPM